MASHNRKRERRQAQRRDEAWAARHGGTLFQRVDPDGPPIPCGCRGCRRGAVWVITFGLDLGKQRTRRMTACDAHLGTMTDAADHYHYE